jgi:two-component system, OmpR family, phosphate regulon sensor histidine kinase PhoR
MSWALGFIAAVLLVICWRQQRRSRAAHSRTLDWLDRLLSDTASSDMTADASPSLSDVAARVEKLRLRTLQLRKEQSAEATNLQTILATMAEGVMVVDRHHTIRLANPSLTQILSLAADPVGQTVLAALRDIHFHEIVTATFSTGQPQTLDVSLDAGKPSRHLSLVATPLRVSGEPGVLVIFHDVTRLKQLEQVRRAFVANVSHELRTPLAIFQGYLETILDNPEMPRPELVELLQILKRHSTRLNALVEDLLVLARLESRSERLSFEPIVPSELLRDAVTDWRLEAKKRNIKLAAACSPETPEFEADSLRIEQVLNNLLDNALKHSDPGDVVTVRACSRDDTVELVVEDTGRGIPPQDLPHIFERFYRADKARQREHGGTGLGLSIVKHIVQLHGGTVHAESTYGRGTRIILHLPIQQPSHPALTAEPGGQVETPVNSDEH